MPLNFDDMTVMIIARNAGKTIERAIRSVLQDSPVRILLVDDASDDDTAERALNLAGDRIRIVRPESSVGTGNARQTALQSVQTPFAIWLDADDEFLPGRTEAHLRRLSDGDIELVYDTGVLVDGLTGDRISELAMPDFIVRDRKLGFLLERNWLPILQCSFAVEFVRQFGYDRSFRDAEDYDIMMRSLISGGRAEFLESQGYRYYHYPASVSRHLSASVGYFTCALKRYSAQQVTEFVAASGNLSMAEQAYVKTCWHVMTGNLDGVEAELKSFCNSLEPVTPYQRSAEVLAQFMSGVVDLLQERPAAAEIRFRQALETWVSPEGYNNLAVACWYLERRDEAVQYWEKALTLSPGYVDALLNLKNTEAAKQRRVTKLPLRPKPNRPDYGLDIV